MDILRTSLAPICTAAWKEINQTAIDALSTALSARKVVDVEGPMGLQYAALPIGRINVPDNQPGELKYGIHQVLPLVEARIPFELNIWELDNAARGANDINLDALEEAVAKIAQFEESVIYEGFNDAYIKGLKDSSFCKPIPFPENQKEVLGAITHALADFKLNSVAGPYSLVVNSEKWQAINSIVDGYPLRKQLENLLGGSIILAPHVKDSFIISQRGGDFRLVIGQDVSIGYDSHNSKTVKLYLTESFTFQVIEPKAVAVLV